MSAFTRTIPGGEIVWIHVNSDWSGDAIVHLVKPSKERHSAAIGAKQLLIGDIDFVGDEALPLRAWCAAVSLAVEACMQQRALEILEGHLFISNETRPR